MMNKDLTPSLPASVIPVQKRSLHYFWVVMACLFPIITAMGFTFDYIRIFTTNLNTHWFAHVHGGIMAAWLFVFNAQTILAARGNLKFHRQLGLLSVGLAVLVLLSMVIAVVRPFVAYPPPVEDGAWDMLLLQFYGILLFGLFFTWGIFLRKKAASHKRLLFFSTLILLQAGIDRIRFLPGIEAGFVVGFIYLDALIIPLLVYDMITLKRIHKMTIIGSMITVVVQIGVLSMVGSSTWHRFWFNRLAPFVEQVVEVKLSDPQIEPLLGDYGDQYWHMTILRDDGKIYLQFPDLTRMEIAATSENEWFARTTYWKISFIRAADGTVLKIINRQPNITWEAGRFKKN